MKTREQLIEEKITLVETIADRNRRIDELENRDIKNLLAAERKAATACRENERLLSKCRERNHELAEWCIDLKTLLGAVQLEADNGIEAAESRDTQTRSEAQQALERIAEMIEEGLTDAK